MRPHEWFRNCRKRDPGKRLFNFRSRSMDSTLNVIALMRSSNVKDASDIKPKYFCDETCWTGLLSKKTGGFTTFLTLQIKVTSYACLNRSGLKLLFHWKAHSFILSKSSSSCLGVEFGHYYRKQRSAICKKF